MSKAKKIAAALALAGAVALGFAVPAGACACPADDAHKQVARWHLTGGEQLDITANRHATRRVARAVGDAWLDSTVWAPGTLNAAGKRWTKTFSSAYRNLGRELVYRNGRARVNLYWSKYGAG